MASEEPVAGSDADLAQRIGAGDRRAEDMLVRRYLRQVVMQVVARTRNLQSAQEIANDVLMSVVIALRRGAVRDTARVGAFVRGTTENLINNHFRACRRLPPTRTLGAVEIENISEHDMCQEDQDWRALNRCLAALSQSDQHVLRLSLVDNLKAAEIAARFGQSVGAVRQQKCRATARLKVLLDRE